MSTDLIVLLIVFLMGATGLSFGALLMMVLMKRNTVKVAYAPSAVSSS